MMMKKFFLKRLKYYFLLMLIPTVILFCISMGITIRQGNQALCATADNNLSSVQENINLVINNALYQHDLMTNNPQLNLALQKVLLFSAMDYSDYIFINSMKAILASIANSHPYISSIYLYLDQYTDFFSSSKGVCYLEDYYDTSWYSTYKNLSDDENMWIEARQLIESSYSPPRDIITVYQRMTYYKGVIVVNIDAAEFKQILASMITQQDENFYLLNCNQEVLVSHQGEGDLSIDFSSVFQAYSGPDGLPNHQWMNTENGVCMITVRHFDDFNIYLISAIGIGAMLDKLLELSYLLILVLFFNCLLIFFLAYETTKRSFVQINYVIESLQNAENGIYPGPHEVPFNDEFGVIMNNVISLFLNTTFLNSQLQEQKYKKEAAELAALQLQINPHFLFNTLQTLNMESLKLSCGSPTSVNRIIEQLSDILKYSLADSKKMVNLEDEIAYLKKYISIQNYRFGELFVIYYEIEPGLEQMQVMRLILQPMIENSIDHGIRPLRRLGFIKLKIYSKDGQICFVVIDTGVGMSREEVRTLYERIFDSNSRNIGLTNVNRRLILRYGEKSALHIQSHRGMGTCISFSIPMDGVATQ